MMEREVFPLGGAAVGFVTLSPLPSKLQGPSSHTGDIPTPYSAGGLKNQGGLDIVSQKKEVRATVPTVTSVTKPQKAYNKERTAYIYSSHSSHRKNQI